MSTFVQLFSDDVAARAMRVGYQFTGTLNHASGEGVGYTYVGDPDSELIVYRSGLMRVIEEHRNIDRFLITIETEEELLGRLEGTLLGALLFRHKLHVLLDVLATPG